MLGLKIVSIKRYKRLLIETYGKGFTEGQASIVKSETAGKRCFILGRAAPNKVERQIRDICEREGL
jgi:hypothetical protein